MLEPELVGPVEATVRGIATAARSLRLYPPTSPIPRQSVDAAFQALSAVLGSQPSLTLDVAREGFTCRGTALAASIGGGSELADMLRSHGVQQVLFLPGCGVDELLAFLGVVMHAPESIRAQGGVTSALATAGAAGIRVVTVSLTVAGQMEEPAEGEDVDEFFRDLATDPDKLTTWLAAAAAGGDPRTLAEGLEELERAAGDERERFLATLALAFQRQETDSKDVLLTIGMDDLGGREVVGGMIDRLPSTEVSASLTGGLYGKNMLSLSTALTNLPMGGRLDEIIAEVRASLETEGHGSREVEFLDHMVAVRNDPRPEAALVSSDATYAQVAQAARVAAEAVDATRTEVAQSVAHTAAHSVPTMLALLDQQRDFNLYVKSLDALAGIVPRLVRENELQTAVSVLGEIAERENRTSQPWPELTQRLRAAMAAATGRATMSTLVDALSADPDTVSAYAHRILQVADDAGKTAFVEETLARKDDRALALAESLLGRRMIDLLASVAPRASVSQLGPLVRKLADHGDPSAMQAIDAVLRRPDELARVEAAEGLAGTTNPAAVRKLGALLADPSPKVVSAAARALARTRLPGAAEALAERLEALDVDNKDFAIGRELIAALAQSPSPAATAALHHLADRKALIKRGRFVEVQQLAREALQVQSQRRQQ